MKGIFFFLANEKIANKMKCRYYIAHNWIVPVGGSAQPNNEMLSARPTSGRHEPSIPFHLRQDRHLSSSSSFLLCSSSRRRSPLPLPLLLLLPAATPSSATPHHILSPHGGASSSGTSGRRAAQRLRVRHADGGGGGAGPPRPRPALLPRAPPRPPQVQPQGPRLPGHPPRPRPRRQRKGLSISLSRTCTARRVAGLNLLPLSVYALLPGFHGAHRQGTPRVRPVRGRGVREENRRGLADREYAGLESQHNLIDCCDSY